ncbi:MAG: 50S ribosomal protein L9 [Verrucomicrobiota bacterium]|jgi:large subunit ribosomal protein L9|nr:50S ribosomal protein L9 [Verrucomicrobiota bacterium]
MGKAIEVILLEDVADTGRSGDTCRVKAGYARNFLFPKKLAVTMTPGTKRLIEKKREEAVIRLQKEKKDAEALLARLEKVTVTVPVKANADGRLFGSVSAADVLAKLAEAGIELGKKQLVMYEAFKAVGEHEAALNLHPEVRGKLIVKVTAEKLAEEADHAE